jgi:hypothetical protein
VPRVVNAALAACLLLFLVPLFTHLDDVRTGARVLLVLLAVPFGLLAVACAVSAVRPGTVAQLAHRAKRLR